MIKEKLYHFSRLVALFNPEDTFDTCHPCNILLIVDAIIHRKKWKSLLGRYPEAIFNDDPFLDDRYLLRKLSNIHKNMSTIIQKYPPGTLKNPTIFYVLAYRLLPDYHHEVALLKEMDHGLHQWLAWTRNNGIAITQEFLIDEHQNKHITNYYHDDLRKLFHQCRNRLKNHAKIEHKEQIPPMIKRK